MNVCAKPRCPGPGAAVLYFRYADRLAFLEDLTEVEPSPHSYVLCASCADSLRPPRGWELDDRRTLEAPVPLHDPGEEDDVPDEAPTARQIFFGTSA